MHLNEGKTVHHTNHHTARWEKTSSPDVQHNSKDTIANICTSNKDYGGCFSNRDSTDDLIAINKIKCVNIPPRVLLRKSSRIHDFNQEEIREKLQAFPGGSIDLLRQESGVAVLTVNNPSRMNAFSGRVGSALWVCGGSGPQVMVLILSVQAA